MRLIEVQEIENTPTLFVEDPYADLVSDELYTALLGRVVEKAYQMSTERGGEIAVAAHDKDMKRLLKGMADKGELDYDETTFTTTFPLSRNGVEYSDSFGGRVLSGTTVSCHQAGYFIIDAENDE